MSGIVKAVHCSAGHTLAKLSQPSITLVAGLGVEGDAHSGEKVKHRSRVLQDPNQPNLRQVHLIHSELFDELQQSGFEVGPGRIGENVTTSGIDLLGLPTGARLRLGPDTVVEITGLRNPCSQLETIHKGLMAGCLGRDVDGNLIRKAGIMGIVLEGGKVSPGDTIQVELPAGVHRPLERV
ncbi:MAG: MOSC domain-containing protein [Planctomycetes bacterium]|nr:MOSC domain-containing protein [Planctomycetota bacterium]